MSESKNITDENRPEFIKFLKSIKGQNYSSTLIVEKLFAEGWRTKTGQIISRSTYNHELSNYKEDKEVIKPFVGGQPEIINTPKFELSLEMESKLNIKAAPDLFALYQQLHHEGEAYFKTKKIIKDRQIPLNKIEIDNLLNKIYWQIPTFPVSWLVDHFSFKSKEDLERVVGTPKDVLFLCSECNCEIEIKNRSDLIELNSISKSFIICSSCKRLKELKNMDHESFLKTPEWQELVNVISKKKL